MTNNSKQAVDRILFLIPIAIIGAFFIHTWWTNAPPTKLAAGLTISSIVLFSTFTSLLTKEIGVKGFWIVAKQEKPVLYWVEFVVQLLLGILILMFSFL